MFIAALFIIVRTWKQLRCPSGHAWINILWYIHTMECYSVLKRCELKRSKAMKRQRKNFGFKIRTLVTQGKTKQNGEVEIFGISNDKNLLNVCFMQNVMQ